MREVLSALVGLAKLYAPVGLVPIVLYGKVVVHAMDPIDKDVAALHELDPSIDRMDPTIRNCYLVGIGDLESDNLV